MQVFNIMHEYFFLIPISIFLLLGVMSPGPSFILVAQTAMSKSRIEAIAVSLGMGVGAAIFALIAAMGLIILLQTVPTLYLGLKIVGGSYLCFLAYKMWRNANEQKAENSAEEEQSGVVKMFVIGLLTQLSNPKTAIVFGSAFAAFLPASIPDFTYIYISASAFIIDFVWYVLVAILLSTSKAQQLYANSKKIICGVASGFMGIMGIKLLTTQ